MRYILLLLLIPFSASAETWVCNQTYPEVNDYNKNYLFRFKVENNQVIWDPEDMSHKFRKVYDQNEYIFAIKESNFKSGMMYTLSLNKKDEIFVLKNHDATGIYKNSAMKWSGSCEIVK